MGISKSDFFTAEQNYIANLAKALGHPARIAIIEHLIKVNTCVCGDLVEALPLAQATISQHLKELKMAGIIKGTVEGNSLCYCIDRKQTKVLLDYFAQIHEKACKQDNHCC